MVNSLIFQCLQCVKCCSPERFGAEILSIPIYLDEIEPIRRLAEQKNIEIILEPDFMYFDELNNRLLIATYALQIDKGGCPFHQVGCTIYEARPITCRAYPLSIFQIGDTTGMTLKPECSFVQQHSAELEDLDYFDTGDVFSNEFFYARQLLIKGKEIITQIEQLEAEGKIRVPVKLPVKITEETKAMVKIHLDEVK